MGVAGMAAGGIWIGAVSALRHYRAVNETVSSLLMAYIAIALMNHLVEGAARSASLKTFDPAAGRYLSHRQHPAWRCIGPRRRIIACVLSWL
jgi:simple sugar transport system permease protein